MCPIASSSLPLTQPSQSSSHAMQQRLGCGVVVLHAANQAWRQQPYPDPCESTDYHPHQHKPHLPLPPSLPPSLTVDPTVTILLARPFPLHRTTLLPSPATRHRHPPPATRHPPPATRHPHSDVSTANSATTETRQLRRKR
ncbi:hypothetical protein TcWFU_000774 [Taenia crassiceps]|uniref:Uncharacterized protein n=1 Tax=Taenia crassiceps TaxID=6207 RepID=A0ABR4PZH7_9CEST